MNQYSTILSKLIESIKDENLKKMIYKMFLICWFLICGNYMYSGCVILLNGTPSSGKSSVSACLKNILANDVVVVGIDNHLIWPRAVQIVHQLNLIDNQMFTDQKERAALCSYHIGSLQNEYGCLKCITKDLSKIIIENVPLIFNEFTQIGWANVKCPLYEQTRSLTTKYRFIILDTTLGDSDLEDIALFNEIMHNINVFSTLIYCSPSELVQHVIDRNNLADYHEKRNLLSTVEDFCAMYAPTSPDLAVAILTQQDVEKTLQITQLHLLEDGMLPEVVQEKVVELRKLYFKIFFQDGATEIGIKPDFIHDMVVNTGKFSSQECAQLIYDKLSSLLF